MYGILSLKNGGQARGYWGLLDDLPHSESHTNLKDIFGLTLLNENAPPATINVETVIRALPLLPVLGFTFALSYEFMFFFWLGIELRQVLSLTDIIEASALKILPTVPLLLAGVLITDFEVDSRKGIGEGGQKSRVLTPLTLIKITLFLSAAIYLLFGISPQTGFSSLALIILVTFANITIFPYLAYTGFITFMTVWLLLVATVLFSAMGHSDAHAVRFGDRSKLPLVTTKTPLPDTSQSELRLVRRLSSGILVVADDRTQMWFVNKDNSIVLTFKTDTVQFQGLLCDDDGACLKPLMKFLHSITSQKSTSR